MRSDSSSDGSGRGEHAFRPRDRLRKPADFARLAKPTPAEWAAGFQTATQRVGLAVRFDPAIPGRVRIGVTVGKRLAPQSVQRSLVKRILREAARHALPALRGHAQRHGIDLVLRLKDAFPAPDRMSLPGWRRALRADADTVLQRLALRVRDAAT